MNHARLTAILALTITCATTLTIARAREPFAIYTYSDPVPAPFVKSLAPTFWVNGAIGLRLPQPFRSDPRWPKRTPPSELLKATLGMMSPHRAKLMILDGELFPFDAHISLVNHLIDLRNKFRPDMKLTAYGYWPDANRNEIIDEDQKPGGNPTAQKRIVGSDDLQKFEKRWDVITIDVYLMGEQFFDRDIQFIKSACKLASRLDSLKGKPIYLTVRGSWPNAANEQVQIPDPRLAEYVKTIKECAQGVIVFDPQEYDHKFVQMLAEN